MKRKKYNKKRWLSIRPRQSWKLRLSGTFVAQANVEIRQKCFKTGLPGYTENRHFQNKASDFEEFMFLYYKFDFEYAIIPNVWDYRLY